MVIPWIGLGDPGTIGGLKRVLPTVGVFVGAEEPKVPRFHVKFHHVAWKLP